MIEAGNEMGISKENVWEKVKEKFALSEEEVSEYFAQYWKDV